MTTSFHINTVWHHVKWDADGRKGVDQHGKAWYNMLDPEDDGGMKMDPAANPKYKAEAQYQKVMAKQRSAKEIAMLVDASRYMETHEEHYERQRAQRLCA